MPQSVYHRWVSAVRVGQRVALLAELALRPQGRVAEADVVWATRLRA